jgi:probable phosphoglycerate mutase
VSASASRRPTIVLLVRHGTTPTTGRKLPGRARGLHLADEGRRQAEAVAQRLSSVPLAAIYASPLERARETAAPVAAARRQAVRVDPDLSDLDVGDWTGASLRRLARRPEWRVVQRHPSGFRFPGGESFVAMQARVTEAIGRIVERHRGNTVMAVSHADPIKAAIAQALGIHLDLFQRIAVSPGSVTAVAYGTDAPVVLALNSVGDDLARILKR